jgi:hypothetical protein
VAAGVSGLHTWKHTRLGLDYRLSASHYANASFYDSITQSLGLGVTHMLSRHTVFSLNTSAGLAPQFNTPTILPSSVPFDPSTLYQPSSQFYTNRTFFASSSANLSLQRSTRLSFNLGLDGFLSRFRSNALYGTTGGGARGDVQYRLSRRSTIGAGYSYTHFGYTGIFSSTDVNALVGTYAVALTRTLEISAYGGVARYETKFVQTVAVDPAVAALIGISTAQRVAYTLNYTPTMSARLSRVVRHGVFFASVGRAVTPGNGLFLTSTNNFVSGGYNFTGLRRWSLALVGSYSGSNSVGNVIGGYQNYTASLNASRLVVPHVYGTFSVNMNRADSGDFNNYNKWQYFVNLGFSFTPSGVALRLW